MPISWRMCFGAKEDEDYYNRVKKYIHDNSLDKNIILLGERQDIPSILKEIDCLVIPSDNESFGMIAVEALAAGTPVLSTPNDGLVRFWSMMIDLLQILMMRKA